MLLKKYLVWSFGVTIYEIIWRKTPYEGIDARKSIFSVVFKIQKNSMKFL